MHLGDEVLEHLLRDGEIGDDAVLERADRPDVRWRTAEHPLGVEADGDYAVMAVAVVADRDDRRFVENNALVT